MFEMLKMFAFEALEMPDTQQLWHLERRLESQISACDSFYRAAQRCFRNADSALWRLLRRKGVGDTKQAYNRISTDIMRRSGSAEELLDRLTFDTAHDRLKAAGSIRRIEKHLGSMSYGRKQRSNDCADLLCLVRLQRDPQVLLNWACTQGMGADVPPHQSTR
jgi:hypothetical protein